MDATALYWPAKARALSRIARNSARHPMVIALAASLALADAPAWLAAQAIRDELRARVVYSTERGDIFDDAATVLARGVDDCDGHAVAAAAIGAAAGYGARIVGLVFPGERQPGHVRAELSDDGQTWWPADSTPMPPGLRMTLHRPIASVSTPREAGPAVSLPPPGRLSPHPVGYVPGFSELAELGNAVVELTGDLLAGGLDAVGLDEAADWLRDEVRDVARDPLLLQVGFGLIGTCVLAPPLCGAAVVAAKGVLVAEGVRRYGPQAWAQWGADRITNEISGVRGEVPPAVWGSGMQEARRQLIARTDDPDVLHVLMTGGAPADEGPALDFSTLRLPGFTVVDRAAGISAAARRTDGGDTLARVSKFYAPRRNPLFLASGLGLLALAAAGGAR